MSVDEIHLLDYKSIVNDTFRQKVDEFKSSFEKRARHSLKYLIEAPGRVNLIGDHIDYHGFSVLPMAIENSIWIGLSIRKKTHSDNDPGKLTILNQQESYPDMVCSHSFSYGRNLNTSYEWYNYVLCGYHGTIAKQILQITPDKVFDHAKQSCQIHDDPLSSLGDMELFVQSDLPSASGLSSSSALVCASAIATHLFLRESKVGSHDVNLSRIRLAEDCSRFEHLIGTHGGGMDQAVILTADEGFAKHVEFYPKFACQNVRLPNDVVWLVSHCGVDYPKAATVGFNSRVLETKLGAAMIAKKLQARLGGDKDSINLDKTITLAKVKQTYMGGWNIEKIVSTLREQVFTDETVTIDLISSTLQMNLDDLLSKFGTTEQFLEQTLTENSNLRKRCEHVFEEADRVKQFKLICESSRDPEKLGELMTASHLSLRDKYECTHEALDKLVDAALEAGAFGARVTGAGWGGCIVALVESSKCESVLAKLKSMSKFTTKTEPKSGCTVIKF